MSINRSTGHDVNEQPERTPPLLLSPISQFYPTFPGYPLQFHPWPSTHLPPNIEQPWGEQWSSSPGVYPPWLMPHYSTKSSVQSSSDPSSEEYMVNTLRRIYSNDDGSIEIERVKVHRKHQAGQPDSKDLSITPCSFYSYPSAEDSRLVPAKYPLNERRPPPRKKKKKNEGKVGVALGSPPPSSWCSPCLPYLPCPYPYPYPFAYMLPLPPGATCIQKPEANVHTKTGVESRITRVESPQSGSRENTVQSPVLLRSFSPTEESQMTDSQATDGAPSDRVLLHEYIRSSEEKETMDSINHMPDRSDLGSEVDKTGDWMEDLGKNLHSHVESSSGNQDCSFQTAPSYAPSPPSRRKKMSVRNPKEDPKIDIDNENYDEDLAYAFQKLEQSVDAFRSQISLNSFQEDRDAVDQPVQPVPLPPKMRGKKMRGEPPSEGRDSRSSDSFHSTRLSTDDHLPLETDSTDAVLSTGLPNAKEGTGTHYRSGCQRNEIYYWVILQGEDGPASMGDLTLPDDRQREAWRAEVSVWRARLVVSLCRGRGLEEQDWSTFQLLVQHPLLLEMKLSLLNGRSLCAANCNVGAGILRSALLHLTSIGEVLLKPEKERPQGWKSLAVDPNQPWAPVKGSVEILQVLGYRPREDGVLRYRKRYAPETSIIARLTLDMLLLAEELRLYLTGLHSYPCNVSCLFVSPFPSSLINHTEGGYFPSTYSRPSSVTSGSFVSASSASLNLRLDSQASSITEDETVTLQPSFICVNKNDTDGRLGLLAYPVTTATNKSQSELITSSVPDHSGDSSLIAVPGIVSHSLPVVEATTSPSPSADRSVSTDMSSLPDLLPDSPALEQSSHTKTDTDDVSNESVTPIASPELGETVELLSAEIETDKEEGNNLNKENKEAFHVENQTSSSVLLGVDDTKNMQTELQTGRDTDKVMKTNPDNPDEHIYEEIGESRAQLHPVKTTNEDSSEPPPLPPKTKKDFCVVENFKAYEQVDWSSSSQPSSLRGGSAGVRRKKRRAPMPPDFMPLNWKADETASTSRLDTAGNAEMTLSPKKSISASLTETIKKSYSKTFFAKNDNQPTPQEQKISLTDRKGSYSPAVNSTSHLKDGDSQEEKNPFVVPHEKPSGYVGKNPFYEEIRPAGKISDTAKCLVTQSSEKLDLKADEKSVPTKEASDTVHEDVPCKSDRTSPIIAATAENNTTTVSESHDSSVTTEKEVEPTQIVCSDKMTVEASASPGLSNKSKKNQKEEPQLGFPAAASSKNILAGSIDHHLNSGLSDKERSGIHVVNKADCCDTEDPGPRDQISGDVKSPKSVNQRKSELSASKNNSDGLSQVTEGMSSARDKTEGQPAENVINNSISVILPVHPLVPSPFHIADDIPYIDTQDILTYKGKVNEQTQKKKHDIYVRTSSIISRPPPTVPFIDEGDTSFKPPPLPLGPPPETPHTTPPATPSDSPPPTPPSTSPPHTPDGSSSPSLLPFLDIQEEQATHPLTSNTSVFQGPLNILEQAKDRVENKAETNYASQVTINMLPGLGGNRTQGQLIKKPETDIKDHYEIPELQEENKIFLGENQSLLPELQEENKKCAEKIQENLQTLSEKAKGPVLAETCQIREQLTGNDFQIPDSSKAPELPPKTGDKILRAQSEDLNVNQTPNKAQLEDEYEIPEAPEEKAGLNSEERRVTPELPKKKDNFNASGYEIPEALPTENSTKSCTNVPSTSASADTCNSHALKVGKSSPLRPPRHRKPEQTPPLPPKGTISKGPPRLPPKTSGTLSGTTSQSSVGSSCRSTTPVVYRHSYSPTLRSANSTPSTPKPSSCSKTFSQKSSKTRKSWPSLFCDCIYGSPYGSQHKS